MNTAEEWARDQGVVLISLDTYLNSPLFAPVYEQRTGYRGHSIAFRKDLA